MNHTPGPWGIESDGFSVHMGGQVVATAIAPDGSSIDEQRANARLIAKAPIAPKLAEALRALLRVPDNKADAVHAYEQARAALAEWDAQP